MYYVHYVYVHVYEYPQRPEECNWILFIWELLGGVSCHVGAGSLTLVLRKSSRRS